MALICALTAVACFLLTALTGWWPFLVAIPVLLLLALGALLTAGPVGWPALRS